MPPMPQRPSQPSQVAQQCPACGGDPTRGRKKGEPACKVCAGGMSDSPLGKQAMEQASKAGAAKIRQAAQQRQETAAREQMQRRAIAGGGAQGMRPGMEAPQRQPKIDPRVLEQLIARARGGR